MVYRALFKAGEEYDIRGAGLRAMDSIRLEKSYAIWGHDLTFEHTALEYTVLESNLAWFVKMDSANFEGKDALIAQAQAKAGLKRKLRLT